MSEEVLYFAIREKGTNRFIGCKELIAEGVDGMIEHPYDEVFTPMEGEAHFIIPKHKESVWEVVPVKAEIKITLTPTVDPAREYYDKKNKL